jgi:RHS repeat-associated protein
LNRNTRKFLLLVLLWLIPALSALAGTPTVTYIYTDPQGTPLAETDAQGNVTATFDYRPYGSQALGTPPKGPGYTGHVNDPDTGLIYMQARYYDPTVGNFFGADPNGFKPGDFFGFNRFVYAMNDPARYVDLTGMVAADPSDPPQTLPPTTVTANRAPDIVLVPPPRPNLPVSRPESRQETMNIICQYSGPPHDGLVDRSGSWNDLNLRNAEHYFFGNQLGRTIGPAAPVVVVWYELPKYPRYPFGATTRPTALGLEMGLLGAADGWANGRSSPLACGRK